MTYNSLLNDLRAYLERGATLATDPTVYEMLPTLIGMAERRLARELKIQGTVNVVTTALIAGQSVYDKPDRWRETVSIFVGTGTGNNTRSEVYPTTTGTPRFYADYDYSHWLIAPTPSSALPMEILYYEIPPLLDDSNQTNWFTEYAPNALLYAALLEATPFLKNDERIATWEGFYNRAVAALNGEDIRQISDRGIIRRED
jgi:hypothetical protein